jgi:hypothetical protein
MKMYKLGACYFLALALAGAYLGIANITSDFFGGVSLIIVAGFYFRSVPHLWKNSMDGLALTTIGSALLWLLAFNDLLCIGTGSLEHLTPSLTLTPFSLVTILLMR